jgi:thiamine-phosphate pyrophosphorylase
VTDRHAVDPSARTERDALAALEAQLDEAIEAGIDLIQVRERDLEARDLSACVRRLVEKLRSTPTRVVVNDRADVAVAAGAHGLHLRSDGPQAARIRQWLGEAFMIGRSVHSPSEALAAGPVDYLVFGTVFPSRSKLDGPAAGVTGLERTVEAAGAPVLAIGGITPDRVADCRAAGAAGIAAIGVFLPPGRTPDALGPRAAIASFRERWEQAGQAQRTEPGEP